MRFRKQRRVVVFGSFDILHPGHLRFLQDAKRLGTELVAVVTRDARIKAEKGRVPVFNEKERLLMVRSIGMVDKALLGDLPGKWTMIEKLKPQVVVVGHDQKMPTRTTRCKTIRLSARMRSRYSSSRIRAALQEIT